MNEQNETELNELPEAVKLAVNTGGPTPRYEEAIHEAAERLHAKIREACEAGFEVWAHKGSGRILKMGAVGARRHIRFPYSRLPHIQPRADDDECELVVERIEVREGFG